MPTIPQVTQERSSLLKKALLGNAAFSVLTGSEMVLFPETVSSFLGFNAPGQLRELGAALLVFAAVLVVTATRRPIRLWAAGTITALDASWVLGTAALLIGRPETFNTAGTVTAVVVALVVADVAFLQFLGIRRVMRGAGGAAERAAAPLSPARAS